MENKKQIYSKFGSGIARWTNAGAVSVCGNAFHSERFLNTKDLPGYFNAAAAANSNIQKVKELNGFFAVVIISGSSLFAAVDRVRSIPLFYCIKKDGIYISDNPDWIAGLIIESECRNDTTSEYELLLTRYVTGPNTLNSDIKQLQAGEVIFSDASYNICSERYFSFLPGIGNILKYSSINEAYDMHHRILIDCVKRAVTFAGGRTIVLPLSGGYDSRLIAVMLKNSGYKKIIAYSYGKIDNPEAQLSKKVAENLGIPWHFIPYNRDEIYSQINSDEWKYFNSIADGRCCACFDRDWPAVLELKKKGIIPEDSIFMPGHSGDFTAGGHMPSNFMYKKNVKIKLLIEEILRRHYTMWRFCTEAVCNQEIVRKLKRRICESLGLSAHSENKSINAKTAIALYEKWVWQEFEAKYLINSVRVYEFFGYSWWMPLLDSRYIEFWNKMPVNLRYKKKLYDKYAAEKYSEAAGINLIKAQFRNDCTSKMALYKKKVSGSFIDLVRFLPFCDTLRAIKKALYKKELMLASSEDLEHDWEQSMGRLSKGVYTKLREYMTCRNSCSTLEKLGLIRYDDRDVSEEVIALLKALAGRDIGKC